MFLACAVLGTLTHLRNADYRSGLSIWQDTVAKAPDNERAHYNVGLLLYGRGRVSEAIPHYQRALEIDSGYAEAHNNLAIAFQDQGDLTEAIAHYQKALEIKPHDAEAHFNMGDAYYRQGKLAEAISHYQRALDIEPRFADADRNLGIVFRRQNRLTEAIACYQKALEIKPHDAEAHYNLGNAYYQQGRLAEAISHYQRALDIKPDLAEAHNNLGAAFFRQRRIPEALAHWREAIRLRPNDAFRLNETAWILATHADASIRNGAAAVELANRAARLSGRRDPAVLDTLAAADAEAGRLSDAVHVAQKALALAASQRNTALAEKISARIKLYQAGVAYHDSP
jgi:superkiller protein 3